MDAEWFAVDGDGCVAYFAARGDAPVPRRYREVVGDELGWYEIEDLLDAAGLRFDSRELTEAPYPLMWQARGAACVPATDRASGARAAVLRLSVAAAEEEILPRVTSFERLGGLLVHVDGHGLAEKVRRWLDAGVVERAILRAFDDREEPRGWYFGLFDYAADDAVYRRFGAPAHPRRITELPTPVRELVRVVPLLDVRFRAALQLEPARLVPTLWDGEPTTPPEPPAWTPPAVALDATGRQLLADALDGDPGRSAVLADWLLERGDPTGERLRAGAPFPDALAMLPRALQQSLAVTVYERALPDLAQLTADEAPARALATKRDWLAGRADDDDLSRARDALAGGWGSAVAAAEPRLPAVLNEASWLAAAASDRPWDDARAAAVAAQIADIREALR